MYCKRKSLNSKRFYFEKRCSNFTISLSTNRKQNDLPKNTDKGFFFPKMAYCIAYTWVLKDENILFLFVVNLKLILFRLTLQVQYISRVSPHRQSIPAG